MNPEILEGFLQASLPMSMIATATGSLLGLVVGMIPGMTISTGIIIVLPATFVLDPVISISLLLGLYVGGMMGGVLLQYCLVFLELLQHQQLPWTVIRCQSGVKLDAHWALQ